ncbi:DUF4369 domain-containing protein [Flagellimonas sp. S174]|uniref:DUF4369 domain-containing protein n=1 Tax=Flagellimonas sp. S174 TaxID=3410790 RepID=UPI003BF4E99D
MKRILLFSILSLLIWSCSTEKKYNMTVSGNIKGLKKGKLFFQQFKDSSVVNLDSLEIKGDGTFSFSHYLESPEVLYLYLEKEDNNDINDRIIFFGEPGEIVINTSWKTFDLSPEISGSKSHDKMEEFNEMISQFNIKELELTQKFSSEEIREDSLAVDSIQQLIRGNIISRYRYALNFGLNNADSYATPYIMMTEAAEANPKYLDSIYSQLTPEVLGSKYGKEFKEFLKKE